MERGRIHGLPTFLSTHIISGTDKATNFKFRTHIFSIDRNKSPLQISGKVAGCVVRTLETFQGTHILGASHGLLCDSSAVLYSLLRLGELLLLPVHVHATLLNSRKIKYGTVIYARQSHDKSHTKQTILFGAHTETFKKVTNAMHSWTNLLEK